MRKGLPQPRERLVEARNERKLSQKEVADLLGTSDVNVSRWERGITRPTSYFRKKLIHFFGKTEEELDLTQPLTKEGRLPHTQAITDASTFSEEVTFKKAVSSTQPIYDFSIPLSPPFHIVGRDEELASLRERLRKGESVAMAALHGLPGVGKTTLAITLAHDAEIREYFHDGILWAGLGPTPDISSILSRWSSLLGIAASDVQGEQDREALTLRLCRALESRRMLLVIDDAWKLEDALAFKVGGPHCAYLITTRFPGIASVLAPQATRGIRELSESDSMDLLRMLAPAVVDGETQKVHELALLVGGLPLALTLLGNYLRQQAYSGQARRVDAALERLSDARERLHISEPRGPRERHSSLQTGAPLSLQAVIDITGKQLAPEVKVALAALAVFPPKPDSFSEEAALAAANCDVATLDMLIDTGLLQSAGESRYTLHQTISDYARAALQDDVIPYARLISYMADFVERHKKAYELLEPEYNSIIAALEAAHTLDAQLHKTQEMMRCIYAFIPYLRSRGLYELAEKQLQRAFDSATYLGDDDGKSQALLYLGEIAQKRGNYEQAETYLQDGLRLARQIGNPERISALLADLGWITWKRGEYSRAEGYLNEGLLLTQKINNSELICNILESLGSVAASRGDYEQSKICMEEALKLARDTGDREKICTLLINLGVTSGDQGDSAKAKRYFLEGLDYANQLGHREWIILLLINLGGTEADLENYAQAEIYFQDALALAGQIFQREWISALLLNLGEMKQKQGNFLEADEYYQEGLTLSRQLGNPQLTSTGLYGYGNLLLRRKNFEAAEAIFNEMLAVVPEGGQDLLALAHYGFAQIALLQGDVKRALELGKESAAILQSIGHRSAQEVQNWLLSLPT